MTTPIPHEPSNQVEFAEAPFTEFPAVSAIDRVARDHSRSSSFRWIALLGLTVIGSGLAYQLCSTHVDPNAPRVEVEVTGMHCPLQCGLRVESAVESLPGVIRGSVTANLDTGVVTFAVTSPEVVDEPSTRRVIEQAGFGVRSVRLPSSSPRPSEKSPDSPGSPP